MENQQDNSASIQNKKFTEALLEKSAGLKVKTAKVNEKLQELKKQTENLLHIKNDQNPGS
ncbi:hypothetical protein [Pedobacter sp. UYP1]|jgi:hypothetical protein|uniref:hypothetical protein n=1 Tax=Pedobacter sp. UYP1 TaxID=1756396 RepID=UPI003397A509